MRPLLEIPRDRRIADQNGVITPEWERVLDAVCKFVQQSADAIDASSGEAAGSEVDDEWNAFVNANRQD